MVWVALPARHGQAAKVPAGNENAVAVSGPGGVYIARRPSQNFLIFFSDPDGLIAGFKIEDATWSLDSLKAELKFKPGIEGSF